ncbi:TerC family protein [Actibacterium sp.]|uniref:TerC family protein n=1 Tax=Actibacterium sp. TaxID=1872125 RepID=UPI00356697BD
MLELLSDPAVWASFLTLTILEIVLGVDNVIFISIVAQRLPRAQQARARLIGLGGALILRLGLLASIAWIISLAEPFVTVLGLALSWRDLILVGGGLFLLWKAVTEIFNEVEGPEDHGPAKHAATFASIIAQIVVLDLVFSLDSVITAVGIADHLPVMFAAVVVAVGVMMIAAEPIAAFVEAHPSTKMLALSFLVMVGMALIADGLHHHVERGFIYAAMVFAGAVEGLNLLRAKRRRRAV